MSQNETGAGTMPAPEPFNLQQELQDVIRGMEEVLALHPTAHHEAITKHIAVLREWVQGTPADVIDRVATIHVCVEMLLALIPSGIPMVLQHIAESQPMVAALHGLGQQLRTGVDTSGMRRRLNVILGLEPPPVQVRELQDFGPFAALGKDRMN